jgi:hypothetical protein
MKISKSPDPIAITIYLAVRDPHAPLRRPAPGFVYLPHARSVSP